MLGRARRLQFLLGVRHGVALVQISRVSRLEYSSFEKGEFKFVCVCLCV